MIDFELTEEQQMIRDTVGAFARDEIRPAARPADSVRAVQGLVQRVVNTAEALGVPASASLARELLEGVVRSPRSSEACCRRFRDRLRSC